MKKRLAIFVIVFWVCTAMARFVGVLKLTNNENSELFVFGELAMWGVFVVGMAILIAIIPTLRGGNLNLAGTG